MESSLYPINEYQNLKQQCQELVQEAERGNNNSLVSVAKNLIYGENSFPKNVQLGIKYLNNGIMNNNVECMEIYGKILLEGDDGVQKDEEKAIEILTKAAEEFNSNISKVLIVKNIMSKGIQGEIVNYVLAKRYAKEASDNGNAEACVLYGKLCIKQLTNKYGTIKQNFEESFKYLKIAYEQGYPDGIAYYAYFLEFPHGLFIPDIKRAVALTKIACDKGSAFAIFRQGVHNLNGICMPVNTREGWRLINIAKDKDVPGAYFFYGLANYYGSYDMPKNEEEGLKNIKISALKGNLEGLHRYADLADQYPEEIDVNKIKKKLVEEGYIFSEYKYRDFGNDTNICYEAAVQLDKKNYDDAFKILNKGISKHYIHCLNLYADALTTALNKPLEGKEMYKKAANFCCLSSMKDYVDYAEGGKFGPINPDEVNPYKEILEIYKDFL